MEFKDYYQIMGLKPEATSDEIKRAYRKLARKYHPDVSKEADAESKFKELGEAYEVLKDPQKRAQYDGIRQQGWHAGQQYRPDGQGARKGPGFYTEEINPEDLGAFSDFFTSIFGQQPGRGYSPFAREAAASRGEDVHYSIDVRPEDSYHGTTRTIEFPVVEMTDTGQLVRKTRTLNVKIPKGVVNGQHIRLKGQGGPGYRKGPSGDLYLEIKMVDREPFHIDGRDVSVIFPVAPWEAALGAQVRVPTLGGPIEVKIPPNSQTGNKLRLKGRGLPGNPPGNQYIILQIVTPPAMSQTAKDLYQEMAEKIPFNPRERLGV